MISAASSLVTLALLTPGWLPIEVRWAPGDLPVPYCLTANAQNTNLSAAAQRAAVAMGVDAWRSTNVGGGLSCTVYDAVATPQAQCATTRDGNDGQNNFFWENNWQHGSQTIAVTISTSGGDCGSVTDDTGTLFSLGCLIDADIEYNDLDYTWDTTGVETDIASITAHEYGHFIGLGHCNENNTCQFGAGVMYAAYGGGTVRVPFNDDVQGACALYPGTQGGVGWPCSQTNQCNSAPICVNPGQNGFCSTTCGTCPQGFRCGANPQNQSQMVCIRDDGLNRALCETCQGGPNACANSGECFPGLPESNVGRCAIPCPNVQAVDGGCPSMYGCFTAQVGNGSGTFCFPKSSNCTDLANFDELNMGQSCGAQTAACVAGLTCIGICSDECTGPGGQGSCPTGYACETFNFQSGAESFCAPPVLEGQSCTGVVACPSGPCLLDQGQATCFQSCATDPNVCNNAQECNTYTLSGGGSVSICEPPGVPPNPDGGVVDTGVPDANNNNGDASTGPDGSVGSLDAGNNGGTCSCDKTFACDLGCESCDPECDEDGKGGCSGCTSTTVDPSARTHPLALAAWLFLGLALVRLRRFVR